MGVIVNKTTHAAEALARLTSQYQDKPNIAALLATFTAQAQEFETAITAVRDSRTLEGALLVGGEPIDLIGGLVGQAREGSTDATYVKRIRARIRVNKSSGLAEDIYKVFRALLVGTTALLELHPEYPAAFTLRVTGYALPAADAALFTDFLSDAKSAGVGSNLEYLSTTSALSFSFADSPDGLGFGDSTNAATGGQLSGALSAP